MSDALTTSADIDVEVSVVERIAVVANPVPSEPTTLKPASVRFAAFGDKPAACRPCDVSELA
jgi:hypothetical protein